MVIWSEVFHLHHHSHQQLVSQTAKTIHHHPILELDNRNDFGIRFVLPDIS
jgi:hypothetical protein